MSLLNDAVLFLAAAVIGVWLFKRLGLGSVLGYLVAGLFIGPSGLHLFGEVGEVMEISPSWTWCCCCS